MNIKTILLIILAILITIFFMQNNVQVEFWFFGTQKYSLSIIIATTLFVGILVGAILLRPKKRKIDVIDVKESISSENTKYIEPKSYISDDAREDLS